MGRDVKLSSRPILASIVADHHLLEADIRDEQVKAGTEPHRLNRRRLIRPVGD